MTNKHKGDRTEGSTNALLGFIYLFAQWNEEAEVFKDEVEVNQGREHLVCLSARGCGRHIPSRSPSFLAAQRETVALCSPVDRRAISLFGPCLHVSSVPTQS